MQYWKHGVPKHTENNSSIKDSGTKGNNVKGNKMFEIISKIKEKKWVIVQIFISFKTLKRDNYVKNKRELYFFIVYKSY